MLRSIAKKINSIPSYFYRNFVAPRIYSILDRNILSKNLELKDKYVGRRCFVIGAGPSIANTDLSMLKNEYTFVVNEFEKNKQYNALLPKFHLISESNYFTDDGPEYWRERFMEKSKIIPISTSLIINIKAIPFIKKNNLFINHNIYFVGTRGIFTNNLPLNINLNRYVPNPKNSILLCLMTAAWMGFNEIYLLGCEHSFLAQPLGKSKSLGFGHSYQDETSNLDGADDEILKKYISSEELNSNYELTVLNVLQLFRGYRLFYAKAKEIHPKLKILNATPNSFLDVFPFINLKDIQL